MTEPQDPIAPRLSIEEHDVLLAALQSPLLDRDPIVMGACPRLCGRHLLQRAGGMAKANGWRGPPHAFMLTRQGWNLVKAERRRTPIRRAG
jgi:hypothetical protein